MTALVITKLPHKTCSIILLYVMFEMYARLSVTYARCYDKADRPRKLRD